MPLARFAKLEKTRKDRLFVAAKQAFAARGYEGAALQPILAEAGASKGGLYYWFEDRTDLFAWVAGELLALVDAAAGDPANIHDFWNAFEDRTARLGQQRLADGDAARIGRQIAMFPPAVREDERLERLFGLARQNLELWLTRGQFLGAVRDDLPIELLVDLALGVEGAVAGWFDGLEEEPDAQQVVARLAKLQTRLVQRVTGA